MERSLQSDAFELSDYLAVLRRRWRTVALCGLLGLAAAAAYTVLAPKTYTATASVFVTGNTGGATQIVNGRTTGLVDLDTEAQLVQSASVASLAKQILHSPKSATSLIKSVSVTVPPNSQVLRISCSTHRAASAAHCASAFAAAYLQNRSNSTLTNIKDQLAGLQQQVSSLQQKISKLNARIGSLPHGSGPRIIASTELSLATTELTTVSNHVANLNAQMAFTSGGRIITDAVPPSSPSSPRRKLYLPSGLAAGLLVGLILAYRRDRSDKRVRGAREVEVMLDLPVLLDVPPDQKRSRPAIAGPRTRTGQAFAELAHSLSSTLGRGNHVVLVVAASPGYAGSIAAANVAIALARTGSDVALVCADLRGSVTPQLLGLSAGPGLAEVVLDRATVGNVEQRVANTPHLRVITPGLDAKLAADHLERDVIDRLVSRLHISSRYVIFEAAPAAYSADVYALAELADAAVVAVEVSRTLRPEVEETVRRLDKMGAAVLGAVLAPPTTRAVPSAPAPGPAAGPAQVRREKAPEAPKDAGPSDRLVYTPRDTEDRNNRTAFPGDEITGPRQIRPRDTEDAAPQSGAFRPLAESDSVPADEPLARSRRAD